MKEIAKALGLDCDFTVHGDEYLASKYAVTDLATWSFGAIGCSIRALLQRLNFVDTKPDIEVDRRLASLWFGFSIQPIGWDMPPVWDAIAGDYQTSDGWVKLHTNLPHHRAAALSVLGVSAERTKVAAAVRLWEKDKLEAAIVECGGVAAAMHTHAEWAAHPQGMAVAAEPLINWTEPKSVILGQKMAKHWKPTRKRPLAGLRVLDLTRVLAGPIATRTLAGYGADVLRIDPPTWDEPIVVPEVTLGKKCAHLDLRSPADREIFEQLLASADIFVHGYRPDALAGLGYEEAVRQKISPNLIEISLDAYGWTGRWRKRRGFDSLVQMSCGIADAGMHFVQRGAQKDKPTPLPVQALDFATGYLMAAAAIRALDDIIAGNISRSAQLSLARTAELLKAHPQDKLDTDFAGLNTSDFSADIEQTPWGRAKRLRPALSVDGTPMVWRRPSCNLGSAHPRWD